MIVTIMPATAEDSEASKPYVRSILARIATNWENTNFFAKQAERRYEGIREKNVDPHLYDAIPASYARVITYPEISFSVTPDGDVANISITRSSGFTACDLAAFDAVVSSAPFPESKQLPIVNCNFASLRFDETGAIAAGLGQSSDFHSKVFKYDCGSQFKAGSLLALVRPNLEPSYWFHTIPLEVLRRYPGVINESDVHSSSALRALKISTAASQLTSIRAAWSEFYRKHPTATKSEIFEYRDKLDQEFGRWYSKWVQDEPDSDLHGGD
jgi:TonB family protein